jgi:hypothetical protein
MTKREQFLADLVKLLCPESAALDGIEREIDGMER